MTVFSSLEDTMKRPKTSKIVVYTIVEDTIHGLLWVRHRFQCAPSCPFAYTVIYCKNQCFPSEIFHTSWRAYCLVKVIDNIGLELQIADLASIGMDHLERLRFVELIDKTGFELHRASRWFISLSSNATLQVELFTRKEA